MAGCITCNSVIVDDSEQYYVAEDMGPVIISDMIEQHLGHQVDDNGSICSQCFGIIMQEIAHESELPHHRVCVMCNTSLYRRRAHSISQSAEFQYIAGIIARREIPEADLVCFACWVHTRRTIQQQGIITAPPVDLNTCVCCDRITGKRAQTRRHSIPEGPEKNIITARIYPREIPTGGLVCYACWIAARRNVERSTNIVNNQQTSGPPNLHQDSVCAWCRVSLHRRPTHMAIGPVRDEVSARIYPLRPMSVADTLMV